MRWQSRNARAASVACSGAEQTDPEEIKLVHAVRQISPQAQMEFLRVLRAMADHGPFHEHGWSAQAATGAGGAHFAALVAAR